MADEQLPPPTPGSPEPLQPPTDPETDKAVDDIVKQESDEVLQAEDTAAQAEAFVMRQSRWERFKGGWHAWWGDPRKRWSSIVAIIALLAVTFIIPVSRYTVLGLVFKAPVTVRIIDSKTSQPVSGADVTLNGHRAETDAAGKVMLRVHLGYHKLQVDKKYYTTYERRTLIGFGSNRVSAAVKALGRQVAATFTDKITGKPLKNLAVTVGDAKATTDMHGKATLVLPASAVGRPEPVTAAGYNTAKVTIASTDQTNRSTIALTPSGKVYFLSNLSGKIDVVKTNLDGTGRQTVLSGTGTEDGANMLLLASADWKYLALLSRRSGDTASVYLIDTTNGDKLTTVDSGDNTYALIGWSGDNLVYQVTKSTVNDWQSGQQALKSYSASTHQGLLLDSTQGSGTSASDYVKQTYIDPYILGSDVVYGKGWMTNYTAPAALNGKQAELDSISATGASHRLIKSFAEADGQTVSYVGIDMQQSGPASLTVHFNDGTKDSFYDYQNGKLTTDTKLTAADYYDATSTRYLSSPSGNQTLWSEVRDGKNTLLVGDQNATNEKQIASLSSYTPYGWYSDNYLLVSKGDSELYIMGASGGAALKISDYYRPATIGGFGSYGGL